MFKKSLGIFFPFFFLKRSFTGRQYKYGTIWHYKIDSCNAVKHFEDAAKNHFLKEYRLERSWIIFVILQTSIKIVTFASVVLY